MADTTGVLARLQAALSIYDPTWDVSPGSATYKILESVAQEIAIANNNSTLQTYSYDVNTKFGAELDAFTNLFGVYRQIGKRASGLVTFSTGGTAATAILDIPVGTQVAVPISTGYVSAVYFSTTAPAIIGIGDTSTDVPVVATIPGIVGNVPANAITSMVSAVVGVASVNNANAMTGGIDPEPDVALRTRWQNTAFNNTTGTYGKYNLTALQNPNVTYANSIGPETFYSEQLQINSILGATASGGIATLNLVAYNGMTVNNITYTSGTTVTGMTISGTTTPAFLQTTLNTMISGAYPSIVINSGFAYTVSGNNNILNLGATGTFTIGTNLPSPYRLLMVGSGGTATNSGITSSGNYYFYDYVTSNNPDIGVSGTLSYNDGNTVSGSPTFPGQYAFNGELYPQGNELVGNNINSWNQTVYSNNTDYYYPSGTLTPPLTLNIINGTNNVNLFNGNTLQVISEYIPASSRITSVISGNCVDIFTNGTTAAIAQSQSVFNTSFTLSSGNSANYLNTNYYILASGTIASQNTSTSGDIYVPLDFQPVINFPSQLSTATSGVADTVFVFNPTTGSGVTYPIALNRYPYISFNGTVSSGSATSGTNFVNVANANTFLYPGLALANNNLIVSGSQYYISSVSSSGITLNKNVTSSGTNVALSGKALVYPIYDNSIYQNSVFDTTGLAFVPGAGPSGWPTLQNTNGYVSYKYNYNNDTVIVENLVQQSRPIGVNTLVHTASFIPLTINATIVAVNGYSLSTIEANIYNQINALFNKYSYLGTISFANLNTNILNVPGVSNSRVTSVSTVSYDGTVLNTFTKDFNLASNQLPQLTSINFTIRGANNF